MLSAGALDANPLKDILNTRQISSVWVGGHQLGTNRSLCDLGEPPEGRTR